MYKRSPYNDLKQLFLPCFLCRNPVTSVDPEITASKNRHFPVILRIFLVIAGYLFIAYADIRYALCLFLFSLFTFFWVSLSANIQKKEAAYDFGDPGSAVFSGTV